MAWTHPLFQEGHLWPQRDQRTGQVLPPAAGGRGRAVPGSCSSPGLACCVTLAQGLPPLGHFTVATRPAVPFSIVDRHLRTCRSQPSQRDQVQELEVLPKAWVTDWGPTCKDWRPRGKSTRPKLLPGPQRHTLEPGSSLCIPYFVLPAAPWVGPGTVLFTPEKPKLQWEAVTWPRSHRDKEKPVSDLGTSRIKCEHPSPLTRGRHHERERDL